ncbi:unnamed protein product [Allacma fusca]|uniref:Uncharacterized protein n=1 Tax=Allacma fusca TaxID=39272 RepID=A0A8J2L9F0_9HEXA|nr:unnamed protein product [Allacma fusca]
MAVTLLKTKEEENVEKRFYFPSSFLGPFPNHDTLILLLLQVRLAEKGSPLIIMNERMVGNLLSVLVGS